MSTIDSLLSAERGGENKVLPGTNGPRGAADLRLIALSTTPAEAAEPVRRTM